MPCCPTFGTRLKSNNNSGKTAPLSLDCPWCSSDKHWKPNDQSTPRPLDSASAQCVAYHGRLAVHPARNAEDIPLPARWPQCGGVRSALVQGHRRIAGIWRRFAHRPRLVHALYIIPRARWRWAIFSSTSRSARPWTGASSRLSIKVTWRSCSVSSFCILPLRVRDRGASTSSRRGACQLNSRGVVGLVMAVPALAAATLLGLTVVRNHR